MIFAGKSDVLELRNSLKTLETSVSGLQKVVGRLDAAWDEERLKLNNAKDLMARASARLERAADRAPPLAEASDAPSNGDAPPQLDQLTNPLARAMLSGGKG